VFGGVPVLVSADKAKQELGWAPRPANESIIAAAESMIHYGTVPRPGDTAGQQGERYQP